MKHYQHPTAIVGKPPRAPAGLLVHPSEITDGKVTIGEGSVIGPNTILYTGVVIGVNCLIGDGSIIRENTVIGDNVIIGMNITIGPDVHIGSRTRITDFTHITGGTIIGRDCFFGPGTLTANDNFTGQIEPPKFGDRVQIGMGARILPGVTVGDDCLIAACSLVTKNVADYARVKGIPAKCYQ